MTHFKFLKTSAIIYNVYIRYIDVYIFNHFSIETTPKTRSPIMILEYRVNETKVQAAWLKTLYELVEELNCKCKTYIDESYNQTFKLFARTRIIEVYGSETMLGWLKLRMERYLHFISSHGELDGISSEMHETSE